MTVSVSFCDAEFRVKRRVAVQLSVCTTCGTIAPPPSDEEVCTWILETANRLSVMPWTPLDWLQVGRVFCPTCTPAALGKLES